MEHLTEEILGRYQLDPALLPNRVAVEEHLKRCAPCRSTLEAIRLFDACLADPSSWIGLAEEGELPSNLRDLRDFASRVAAEDAHAEHLLADFDDVPAARFAWADIASRPEFHTGGVVRILCQKANKMCEVNPWYALALAEAASTIATILPSSSCPGKGIHELRGHAWKEHANALWFLGRLPESLEKLDLAEAEYDSLPHAGIGTAAVAYIRAWVLSEQDDMGAAAELAKRSAEIAAHLGQTERVLQAQLLQDISPSRNTNIAKPSRFSTSFFSMQRRIRPGSGSRERRKRSGSPMVNLVIFRTQAAF